MAELIRVHRCIRGVKHQYYSRDRDEIIELQNKLASEVAKYTFPWAVNTVKRSGSKHDLPKTIHIKTNRKILSDGSVSEYTKVILIIDRQKLNLYKTFSRRFGTTHTFDEAVDDVILRATKWWYSSSYASSTHEISTSSK